MLKHHKNKYSEANFITVYKVYVLYLHSITGVDKGAFTLFVYMPRFDFNKVNRYFITEWLFTSKLIHHSVVLGNLVKVISFPFTRIFLPVKKPFPKYRFGILNITI